MTTPRQLVEKMVRAFERSATDLFTINRPAEYIEYEKGLYGAMYVKPAKRIARLLAADRELLVLFTSFWDLQARTIQFATDLIDNTKGRLESTMAIIAHQDPNGNSKLKNWGRESGLSVIPVFLVEDLPSGEDLERLLFQEFFSHDAFDVSGPVSDDNQFYGRRTEAQDLARQLQIGQVRACLGIRKIGKTSIINRVLGVLQDYHDCYSVMIDCSKDIIWSMDAGQLLSAIAAAAKRAIGSAEAYADVQNFSGSTSVADGFNALLAETRLAPGPVILFFDEVDYITPGSPTAPEVWREQFNPFWRNLRAIYQEAARTNRRLSVLVSGVSSKWFRTESIQGIENAALAFIPEEYLSPLPNGASVAMIKSIARTSGLIFESDTAGLIAETCSDIPFWIRKACSFIHRNIDIESRPCRPTLDAVAGLLDSFIASEGCTIAEVALSHLFRVYPELETEAISCLDGNPSRGPSQYSAVLEKYGVISSRIGKSRISGKMMISGMEAVVAKRQETPTLTQLSTHTEQPLSFSTVDEWADELALIGAARNKLERRLRSIALNFIRYDALQNKQKGTLPERITKVLDENRRNKMKHLPADEIVEKFNWTDLVRLIERDWGLFSPIFADKSRFSLYASVINERYDAHAKDADRADLAYYRKALKWFEDCVARV